MSGTDGRRKVLQIPLQGGSGNAPTGPVQFRNDWPGLFLLGDYALLVALSVRRLADRLGAVPMDAVTLNSLHTLNKLAELIESDVKVTADQR